MEAGALIAGAGDGLAGHEGDAGRELRQTREYLRVRLAVDGWAAGTDPAQIQEDREALEELSSQVAGGACNAQLRCHTEVLRGYSYFRLGQLDPSIAASMVEQSIGVLGRAHKAVIGYGDIWLELKVLRGLERGYLVSPSREKVAGASLTIQKNRERRLNAAMQEALNDPLHGRAVKWDLGGASA